MSDVNDGVLQLDAIPNWLKPAPGEQPAAAPAAVEIAPADPAAAWLAPDDRQHPEPGVVAEAMQAAAAAWAGPTMGQPVGGPDPAPAPIREPGDDPDPEELPEEGEEEPGLDALELGVAPIAEGILLFKRVWLWPAGTQNEADAAMEFANFIVQLIKAKKHNGNKPQ
jgi:hypothetical protein